MLRPIPPTDNALRPPTAEAGSRRRYELLALRVKSLQSDMAERIDTLSRLQEDRAKTNESHAEAKGEDRRALEQDAIDIYQQIAKCEAELGRATAEYQELTPQLERAKSDLQEDIRSFLKNAVEHSGLPPAVLARRASVSASTITRPLNDPDFSFLPRTITLQKIADAAGIPLPSSFTAGRPEPLADETQGIRLLPITGEAKLGSWSLEGGAISEFESWDAGGIVPVLLSEYAKTPLSAFKFIEPSGQSSLIVSAPAEAAGIRLGDQVVLRRWNGSFAETAIWQVIGGPPLRLSAVCGQQPPEEITLSESSARPPKLLGVVIQTTRERDTKGPLIAK